MSTINKKGLFVTFDGPNGSGKTTVLENVASQLKRKGLDVFCTKEPTTSLFGEFVRDAEENYSGKIFACLVTADRYFHLESEILPALCQGKIVLSDRYVESSFVLQKLDGVDSEFIWTINKQIRVPDLSIVLTAPPKILEKRLLKRFSFSRFERTKSRKKELEYYLDAVKFLSKKGFNIFSFDNGTISLDYNTKRIIKKIMVIFND